MTFDKSDLNHQEIFSGLLDDEETSKSAISSNQTSATDLPSATNIKKNDSLEGNQRDSLMDYSAVSAPWIDNQVFRSHGYGLHLYLITDCHVHIS